MNNNLLFDLETTAFRWLFTQRQCERELSNCIWLRIVSVSVNTVTQKVATMPIFFFTRESDFWIFLNIFGQKSFYLLACFLFCFCECACTVAVFWSLGKRSAILKTWKLKVWKMNNLTSLGKFMNFYFIAAFLSFTFDCGSIHVGFSRLSPAQWRLCLLIFSDKCNYVEFGRPDGWHFSVLIFHRRQPLITCCITLYLSLTATQQSTRSGF